MPRRRVYDTPDGELTAEELVNRFNEYDSHQAASVGMQISSKRLSVICSRLRARGFQVKKYQGGK